MSSVANGQQILSWLESWIEKSRYTKEFEKGIQECLTRRIEETRCWFKLQLQRIAANKHAFGDLDKEQILIAAAIQIPNDFFWTKLIDDPRYGILAIRVLGRTAEQRIILLPYWWQGNPENKQFDLKRLLTESFTSDRKSTTDAIERCQAGWPVDLRNEVANFVRRRRE